MPSLTHFKAHAADVLRRELFQPDSRYVPGRPGIASTDLVATLSVTAKD